MIRRANIDDAQCILDLLRIIFSQHQEYHPDIFEGRESKYSLSDVEALILDKDKDVYVYDDNGVKGYVIAFFKSTYYFVDDICVDPLMMGRGIGKQLMAHVMNHDDVRLNVWIKNKEAIEFYKHLGFEPLTMIMRKKTDI